uniref:F-box domain-containing protein n=1 Tax=Triticum aestivum TaxID=4565 RepID=A0A3B6GWK2_WHEAT
MPRLRRVRPGRAVEEDRLSALPEELIRLILSRLDTRSALSTAVLARRWARVPREIPAYDFRVSDILPLEYDQTIALRRLNLPRDEALCRIVDGPMASCEASTMRAFVDGVTGFLEADGGAARRCPKTLRLEFFQTDDGARIVDRLITTAVGAWGVEDLEVAVRPAFHGPPPGYGIPLEDGDRSRLRSLTLGNCTLPPKLHCYGALTKLVLRDMAASTPVDVYERVFSECARLQALHLTSCGCAGDRLVVCSQIREFVVEGCSFMEIELRDLPMLARLACLTNTVELVFGSVPCLTHTNLTFFVEEDPVVLPPHHDELNQFLDMSPTMENLVIRFTGPIGVKKLDKPLLHLKKLLVADVPSNWDVSWTRTLLMAAPSLEVLHIHVARSEIPETYGIIWSRTSQKQCHPHMKELVMIGFTLTRLQMEFLKYVVSACTSLQRLVLLKDGRVRYHGLWDWDMAREQQECRWRDHDKRAVRRMIQSGPSPLVELTLGFTLG